MTVRRRVDQPDRLVAQLSRDPGGDVQGLTKKGGNLYAQSNDSGAPLSATGGVSGIGGMGKIIAQNLEMSNVDLGTDQATLTDDGKVLYLKVKGPDNIVMKTWSTAPTNNYDAENPGTIMVGFECEVPPNTKESFEVIMVPATAESDAVFLDKSLDLW